MSVSCTHLTPEAALHRKAADTVRLRALTKSLLRLAAAIAREIRIRRDLHQLSGYDDAMLRDIGLSRGGLEGAVRQGRLLPDPMRVEARPGASPCAPRPRSAWTEWR